MSRYREKLNYKPLGPTLEDVLQRNAGIYAHGIRGVAQRIYKDYG